jgi:hypothetical protein
VTPGWRRPSQLASGDGGELTRTHARLAKRTPARGSQRSARRCRRHRTRCGRDSLLWNMAGTVRAGITAMELWATRLGTFVSKVRSLQGSQGGSDLSHGTTLIVGVPRPNRRLVVRADRSRGLAKRRRVGCLAIWISSAKGAPLVSVAPVDLIEPDNLVYPKENRIHPWIPLGV